MKKRTFFNVGMITCANVLVRLMGVFYKIQLAKIISPVALGIYQLAMSVYMFFITPIASGLPNGVSRLCAKYKNNSEDVVLNGIKCAILPIVFLCLIMLFGKDIIARIFLHEQGASMAVVALIPAISLGALASLPAGYYHAKEKSALPAVFEIIEQASKIIFAFVLASFIGGKSDTWDACIPVLAVSFGGVVSFILMFTPLKLPKKPTNVYTKELLQNAVPPTLSRMATSVLHLCTTTVLPLRLVAYGLTKEAALSQYGILTSMAYPVVFMPMTLIGALGVVLLPKIAGNLNRKKYLKGMFYKNLTVSFLVSALFSVLLFFFAPYCSRIIFFQPLAGQFMVMLIPSVLFLGPKIICATVINGLGKQKTLMISSIIDGITGLALTYILVGKFGIYGFILANCLQDITAFAVHFVLCKRFIKGMKSN